MGDTEATRIALAGETDLAGFRRAARRLIAQMVGPDRVSWQVASSDAGELFGQGDDPCSTAEAPPVSVPGFFGALSESAVLHSDPARFGLLYRLLWRLVHEAGLRDDPLDADRMAIEAMARAVRRDLHKMTAFVRFRPLPATALDPEGLLHVAWFEPAHHIVEAVAPFFARRFAQMRWAILTPDRCVHWDGHELRFGPGARRDAAPAADAGESLWLTYYQSIFNPARLKLAMMQKEMPRRYWHNLSEAVLIQPLAAAAVQRGAAMVSRGGSVAARKRPAGADELRVALPAAPSSAESATSLEALHRGEERCRDCPIGALATQAVPGEGPVGARLMLVGEQPGDQEDLHGRPFVGPAGQLLDRALAQLGWDRAEVYVTNAVKHFKYELRGKRRIHKTPAQREAAACLQWLDREIALVKPQAIVALGATAARSLLGPGVSVTAERGTWRVREEDGLRVLVTLHPSALLRLPDAEREAAYARWLDDLSKADRP
jgi:DNA polymerase